MGRKELLWAAVGAIASVAAVIATIYGFYFTHHEASKEIEATVLSRSQILNSSIHQRPTDLRLVYKDREISNASIFQVSIRNSGAQPITATDIEQPIQINLVGASEVISAAVVEKRPQDLPVAVEARSPRGVLVTKSLLNPDDTFVVEIATINTPNGTTDVEGLSARIAGVKRIVFNKSPVAEESGFSWIRLARLSALAAFIGSIITSITGSLLGWISSHRRRV